MFPGTATVARKLYASEAREDRIMPSMRATVRTIWKIYLLFTILGIVGLYLAGMEPFAAVNHSMTGIATGGFTVTPDSYASFNIPIIIVTLFIMIERGVFFFFEEKVGFPEFHVFSKIGYSLFPPDFKSSP
ncbi:hypothetical protein AKJ37_04700 [candidate division MSBL1 archaeon SCGC-AAA259I09]|uniref:Uncharacterized protein n=2 Tax=candidate division MSBL1 TaxID=215777 RepID=A0A133UTD1_9EURY|nr:hypothetical protein AKJ37_04700 [candidate division MSBL1 archaeon SCGC-AAA259I09]KXA97458.1 hypothetical protein AKJ38_01165 [candidate division MSBL1 archaeon SCGC-AAA259I14]